MERIRISDDRFAAFLAVLRRLKIPPAVESATHSFAWPRTTDELANCYFAIVAICHQTSPIGERALQGTINGSTKTGWDCLKEKYLLAATHDKRWSDPHFWMTLSPVELADIYNDSHFGRTLSRVSERAWLLNDLGTRLVSSAQSTISACFRDHKGILGGDRGFLNFLSGFEAYRDPVMKKSLFFIAVASQECDWTLTDPETLSAPVDYHELRGHLRIGTLMIVDPHLEEKVVRGQVLTDAEDVALREKVQEINDRAARETNTSSSVIHYLCWNVFRNCCPRDSRLTHCSQCGPGCTLPELYKRMPGYKGRCVFAQACASANRPHKVQDPPYIGHYY